MDNQHGHVGCVGGFGLCYLGLLDSTFNQLTTLVNGAPTSLVYLNGSKVNARCLIKGAFEYQYQSAYFLRISIRSAGRPERRKAAVSILTAGADAGCVEVAAPLIRGPFCPSLASGRGAGVVCA